MSATTFPEATDPTGTGPTGTGPRVTGPAGGDGRSGPDARIDDLAGATVSAVAGVRVGHWTDPVGRTGCTVVLMPAGTTASGEVRGGAPGTREWALLDPQRTVSRVDAVVLTGGSAFGLGACDGVVRWCEERGIGFPTPVGPVPIVVGMVLFDLMVGDPRARPGPDQGYLACEAARSGSDAVGLGAVGAGGGATVGKWRGPGSARPAGIGSAVARLGDLVVGALVAVNAVGEPRSPSGGLPRIPYVPPSGATLPSRSGIGTASPPASPGAGLVDPGAGAGPLASGAEPAGPPGDGPGVDPSPELQATTVGLVVTNAAIDKAACLRVAQSAHDGLARGLEPVHTAADGDAFVAAATGAVAAPVETVRALAAWAVETAIQRGAPA